MKKVSVIIPAHNEENDIGKTLEALLAQDYKDIEIIVIDNASTDKTSEVARRYSGVKVLNESRKGTNFALECGRKETSGEIIARLDADCLPEKNWITIGLKNFEDENVVGLTGPYDYYDADNFFRYTSLFFQKYIYRFTSWLFQLFHIGAIMTGGNSMMRAKELELMGGFDTSFTFYGDDTDVAKRLSKYGRVAFDPNFVLKTSARRFKKQGEFKIFFLYFYYFLKTTFYRPKKKV